ncbi:MAG: transposase [Planctomycetes bacterium]|nr:transposase [Planctomycetota bacterium]
MSHYRRIKNAGGYYFFTLVTYNRVPFLATPLARAILHSAWQRVQHRRPFESVAACLLPEHLHCIWRLPDGDNDYSTRWTLIKKDFTHNWLKAGGEEIIQSQSRQQRRHRGVWQKRFWEHRIRDPRDLARHIHYIHWNPVKHKLVEKVEDWPFSSYHQHIEAGRYKIPELSEIQEILGDNFGEKWE